MEESVFTISVDLEETLYQAIKDIAEHEGITLSQAARAMISYAYYEINIQIQIDNYHEKTNQDQTKKSQ